MNEEDNRELDEVIDQALDDYLVHIHNWDIRILLHELEILFAIRDKITMLLDKIKNQIIDEGEK